jgi:hypothetical protein
MNRTLARLCSTFLGLLLLNSCESPSGGRGAANVETIRNPTVADMERIDSQMGLQPRQVKKRMRAYDPNTDTATYAPAPSPAPAPAPAPAPPMLAPGPEPLQDTSTPPPQPTVDPATLQKLR